MKRILPALLLAMLVAVPAYGAMTLGETANRNTACQVPNFAGVQVSVGPGTNSYTAPSAGVITSWSHDARQITNAVLKFKVFRAINATTYLTVGESGYQSVATQKLHTFPVAIPVQAGDKIGLATGSNATPGNAPPSCLLAQPPSNVQGEETNEAPDFPAGTSSNDFTRSGNARWSIEAKLEPDADCDGLGDETQDTSVGSCSSVGPPPVPSPIVPAKDTTKPGVTASSGGAQDILDEGGVSLTVTPNESCKLAATGSIALPSSSAAGAKSTSIKLRGTTKSATGGKATKVTLKLPKSKRAKLRKALKRNKLKAKVKLTATDTAGNANSKTYSIKLKK